MFGRVLFTRTHTNDNRHFTVYHTRARARALTHTHIPSLLSAFLKVRFTCRRNVGRGTSAVLFARALPADFFSLPSSRSSFVLPFLRLPLCLSSLVSFVPFVSLCAPRVYLLPPLRLPFLLAAGPALFVCPISRFSLESFVALYISRVASATSLLLQLSLSIRIISPVKLGILAWAKTLFSSYVFKFLNVLNSLMQ